MNEIKPGLYEAIITQRLSDALKASGLEHERAKLGRATGSGRTHTLPEPKLALISRFLVQCTKGTA